ncbi:MAG: DUF1540 domain-containing protein [Ruminococcaceae bacterium]|nr:DUF1540 domain-containing protein [Oscillospiraceae bacterium]
MNNCDNGRCAPGNVISGIKCDVVNCEYHREGNKCQAGSIEVGHGNCSTSKETSCETFKAKNI